MFTKEISAPPAIPRTGTQHQLLAVVGGLAGVIGPLLFTACFVVQGLLRRAEYDPIAEPVSALEAGPHGWIQQLNFVVFGVLMLIFAIGLRVGVRRTSGRSLGLAVVTWWGIGLVLAAVFPLREDAAGRTYDPTGLHSVSGAVFFMSTWVGLGLLSWWLRRDPAWRSLTPYTVLTAVVLMPLFFAMAFLAIPEAGPLHPWAGLGQRLVLAIWFPCLIVLGVRLNQVGRRESRSGNPALVGEDR